MPLFISDEEFSRCSGDTAAVAAKADAFIRGLLHELDTVRAKADAADINAEQNCALIEQKYLHIAGEFSTLESHVAELQSSLDQRRREISEAQSQNHQIEMQLVEKDREIERLRKEAGELHKSRRDLIELNEMKNAELSEKNATMKSYLDKIVHLTEHAAHKEARLSELEAELARCKAACTRLEQEKEIVEKQTFWLNEELNANANSLFELRRKHSELEADMSSKLADMERQFSENSKSLQWNKDRVRELEMKLKSVQEEFISAKDAAAANEEQLSAELSTVNKLNELYKESSEEWSKKAADLEGVIKAVESRLEQVEDDYKEKLEKELSARKQVEKEATDLKEKLEKCEAELETRKKTTNELSNLPPGSFTTELWLESTEADSMLEENSLVVPKIPVGVSGTALAASLLRDGWSLAKMYAKYHEAVDALRHEQLGRKESESLLQRVLNELEEKADAIMDERVEHERMVEAYSLMNQKLQNALNEHSYLERTILQLKADLKRRERDCDLCQNDDLRKQVTVLLKECRDIQLRCGGLMGYDIVDDASNIASRTTTEIEAEHVISQHLLTFKDINGLVEQNAQLRSLVRSLSGQIENQELEFKEKLEMELKKHTEEAASKVAAVLHRAEEQGQMIESLHAAVAMYKRLYEEQNLHLSHTHSSEALAATLFAEVGRNNRKTSIESSQEVAKKSLEKAVERVKCLEDDLAKSRSEIIVLRSECDKMTFEANFARERLDSFMKKFEHQKAEAKGILERNVEFSQLVVDYQRKLRESSESLMAAEELSRKLTMELSVLKQEKEVISNAEKRASDEVRSLSERVLRLQASLGTIQSTEEVREAKFSSLQSKMGSAIDKADNAMKVLESGLNSLREKMLEIVNESCLKYEEVASETVGKDEALTSAMAEITNLKEEMLTKSSQISEMEIQISGLKENLEMEHQKWRAAQTNYERQVVLQSETIQELTKTSEALALLEEEASELRKLANTQKIENILEKHLERLRDELKKEKEDNRIERGRRLKTEKAIKDSYSIVEQEKTKFINEIEKHKKSLKRLSDEVEKLKVVIGNLPEGMNVVQLLSGSNDDFAAPYLSAVETFEKEAQSVFREFGGSLVHAPSQSIVSQAAPGASVLRPKAPEESEKRLALPKASSIETRRAGRLVRINEPQGDTEMSDAEGAGNKPGPSSDTETTQSSIRKRVAPTSTSELREEAVAPGEMNSEAPVLKKSKGSESPEESTEEQPAATLEFTGSQPITEELFDSGELPEG